MSRPCHHPDPIDVHVGRRLRLRRTAVGLSQERLGEAVGLSFHQVEECERGTGPIGASLLYQLAGVLGVPVAFFFDDLPGPPDPVALVPPANAPPSLAGDETVKREILDLMRNVRHIIDPEDRRRLCALARALAEGGKG